MGYIRHNAIIVTSSKRDGLEAAANHARELGLTVIGPSEPLMNRYQTILVVPDGSNEGWAESDAGDAQRAAFRKWLEEQVYEDGSSWLEWAEVAFGRDDRMAVVEHHAWALAHQYAGHAIRRPTS